MQLEQRVLRKPQSAADAFEEKVARLVEAKEDVNEPVIRKEEKAKLRLVMAQGIESRKHRLANAVNKEDAEQLLDLITASVE